MSHTPTQRQARRENMAARAHAYQLIQVIRDMNDDELAQLRAAINGEAGPETLNQPRRALHLDRMAREYPLAPNIDIEAANPMGVR